MSRGRAGRAIATRSRRWGATLEEMPEDATHWSRASMAERAGIKSTIGRIWREFDLQPARTGTFKLSTDPLFVDKVVDVVGLYHDPPDGRWCCAWMRSRHPGAGPVPAGAADDARHAGAAQPRLRPARHHRPVRRVQHRRRHRDRQLCRHHRAAEFKKFLARIDKTVPGLAQVHMICD